VAGGTHYFAHRVSTVSVEKHEEKGGSGAAK
jgi:hypothetical protein